LQAKNIGLRDPNTLIFVRNKNFWQTAAHQSHAGRSGGFHYLVYMRIIGEIPHQACKITLYHWNNRYLIKFEQELLEQTYKVQEYDIASVDEVRRMITDEFVTATLKQFETMRQSLHQALANT